MKINQIIVNEAIKLGDNFDIELGNMVIESHVVGFMNDGVVIEADDKALALLGIGGAVLESVDLNEISTGDYYKKAKISKGVGEIEKAFGRSPEAQAKGAETARRREAGLARLDARHQKARARADAEYKAALPAKYAEKYAGIDIDAEIARLQKELRSATLDYQYGASNTYSAAKQRSDQIAAQLRDLEQAKKILGQQGVAEGLKQTLRKVVPGYAKREIDQKMDAGKFGKTDADKDANFQRYKKIQDKLKEQGVAEGAGRSFLEIVDDFLVDYTGSQSGNSYTWTDGKKVIEVEMDPSDTGTVYWALGIAGRTGKTNWVESGSDNPKNALGIVKNFAKNALPEGVAEGAGNIGNNIKALYQKIYNAGDDEIEYFYHDSPIFAQYWDEYEGDLDSIIAEADPTELQIMLDELESYVQQAGLTEGQFKQQMHVDAERMELAAFVDKYGDEDWIKEFWQAVNNIDEAKYQGRTVPLGKPMQGDVKKFKVYVKNKKGNVVKVNFGDPNMRIKKSNPARRKSFRARHRCATAKDRTSARYWSCRAW